MDYIRRASLAKNTIKKAQPPKGKIPWYDKEIKKCHEKEIKILKNGGMFGQDAYIEADVPLPKEIKDYLLDEEIDFQLKQRKSNG